MRRLINTYLTTLPLLYTHNHNNTTKKKDDRRLLYQYIYIPLTLLKGFEKGYSRFACERELETEQKLQYFDPTLMAVNVVSFSFSRAAQPEAQRPTLLGDLLYLFSNFSAPQLNQGPKAPSA